MARRRRKKKSHRLYALIVIILGIAIIAMTVILLFYVQKIEIKGNEYTEDEVILESVEKDRLSVNSLYLLIKYRYMDYEMPKSLNSMKLGLKNPWTVRITVQEKAITGCFLEGENYVYFDKEGTVVLKKKELAEGVPYIEGVEIGETKLYKKMKVKDEKLFQAILNVVQEVKQFELTPDQILCTESGIELHFGTIRVLLGFDITTKKVAQILPILGKLEGRSGTLHLEHFEDETNTIPFKSDPPPDDPEPSGDTGEDGYSDDDYDDDYYGEYYDGYDYDDDYYDDYYDYDYDDDYDNGYSDYSDEYYDDENY